MLTRHFFGFIFLIFLVLSSQISGQVPLQKLPFWQSSETNMTTTGMVWRDCNNDGYIDVFYSNGNDITISPNTIYISNAGTLPSSASWFSANDEYSGHCAVGDINDDGWADFAVANFLGLERFSSANLSNLYLNSGGVINSVPDWNSGDSMYTFSCALGDADGDGDLDLAFATGEPYYDKINTDRIYFNIDGVLQSSPGWETSAQTQAMDVAWGDVDNNGYLDIAFCYDDRPPAVYFNNGGTIETTPSWQALHNESANTIIFGDVNGDGWLDLVVAFNNQLGGSGRFRVYYNDGFGNLDTDYGWQSATGGYGAALALNDCDKDGDLDLAAGRWFDPPRVYLNTGTTFTTLPVWQSDLSTVVEELAWVDVDGDGLSSPADTIYDVSGKKVFYASKMPLYSIDSVKVDGSLLGNPDYCYDLFSGWVALGQAPTSNIIIFYKYSTRNDLAVANWDTFNQVYANIPVSLAMGHYQLSDILGDNDGIPEAGESIQLGMTILNSGSSTASNVELTLAIDDDRIAITDDYVSLGDIPAYDSASTDSDPFEFDIPGDYVSRIDSFFIELSWNSGADVDTVIFEAALGKPTILLVDDDNGNSYENYYTDALSNMRIPNDNWEILASGLPDAADMGDYELVAWFTGDFRSSPLAAGAVSSMQTFLDGGGNLFLTGQGIAAQLNSSNPSFLENYLKSSYQSTSFIPVLEAVSGANAFDSFTKIAIYGGGGASNQDFPDLIAAVNGGQAELQYLNQSDMGAVSYSGTYNLLFFSFGYEAVASGDSRWKDRDIVMADILRFFSLPVPGSYPIVAEAHMEPGDQYHLADHTPDFSWTYYSSHSIQQAYQIQVGEDSDWSIAEMWDSGPVSSSSGVATYAGYELIDGESYMFRIRVFDGSLWSEWYQEGFRMNSLPTTPGGLNPDDLQCLESDTPLLYHLNSDDYEYDVLTYSYRVYDDPAMTTIIAQADGNPQQPDFTFWQVDYVLSDNTSYYWRVRANDGYEDGPWSDLASFTVNSINQDPEPFGLISPDSGASLSSLLPAFTWAASNDPDPCDSVEYQLFYSTDSLLASPFIISGIDTLSYTLPSPLASGTYFWKVNALDLFGGETSSSSIYNFHIGLRGDANSDGIVDVGDAVFLINYIFRGGPAPFPYFAGDANCDGFTDVGDAVYLISYIFKGGPPPGCDK